MLSDKGRVQTETKIRPGKEKDAKIKLFEVGEGCKDVEEEIKRILEVSAKSTSKIELLIDGGVFSKMLALSDDIKVELNKALNKAAAVIIYRASPKQKQQVV